MAQPHSITASEGRTCDTGSGTDKPEEAAWRESTNTARPASPGTGRSRPTDARSRGQGRGGAWEDGVMAAGRSVSGGDKTF